MSISDYTIVYECNSGVRREMYLKAHSISNARLTADELIPRSCTIRRVYHNPDFN